MQIKKAVADKRAEVNEQIEFLRAKNSQLERTVAHLQRTVGEQKEFYRQVARAVVACEPPERVPWRRPKRAGSKIVAALKLSDWQIGEVIEASETEGFGRFNWRIAQRRVAEVTEAFLQWIWTQRHGYAIDECVVLCEADWISGDIHRELSVTNEFPVPVQAAKAGKLLGETIAKLSAHFGLVRASMVGADNHGRMTPKPQAKQKAANNFSFLVETIAEEYVSRCQNVQVIRAQGMKALVDINGKKFLSEHGDTIKAWMGIPYYGMERARGREAARRMRNGKGFDYQSIAHFHVPAWASGNILVNGSLTGTTEFDHSVGRHAAPSQVAFLVSRKHGVFNFTPFEVR